MRRLLAVLSVVVLATACSNVTDGHPVSINGTPQPSGGSGASVHLSQLWRAQVDGTGQDPHRLVGGAADGQRLYVSDLTGQVWALDAKTGKILWSRQVGQRTGTAVTVAGGLVWFYDTDTGLYVLDPATGRTLWRIERSFVAGQPFEPPVAGGLVAIDQDSLQGLNARTGRPVWTRDQTAIARPEAFFTSDQGATDGRRFFVTARNSEDVEQATLIAVSAGSGRSLWARTLAKSSEVRLLSTDGLAIAEISPTLESGTFYAFDAATGAPRWTATVPEVYDTHTFARLGDQLLVPSTGRHFFALDLADGKVHELAKGSDGAEVGSCLGHPCAMGSDTLTVYDPDGDELTSVDVPREAEIADLVSGPSGEVYLVSGTYVYRYG